MKTRQLKTIGIILTIFLAATSVSLAQHNHGGQGQDNHNAATASGPEIPHGGMGQKAGKYVIEMVVNFLQHEDKVTIYLLNANAKTLRNKGITGTVTFAYQDGSSVTDTLVAKGDERLVAQLKSLNAFTSQVNLQVKGKPIGAIFRHGGMKSHN
jgi:hypothetical protein